MKIAIYPGSFNPWHSGHDDVLQSALKVFDKVIVAVGQHPDKPDNTVNEKWLHMQITEPLSIELHKRIKVTQYAGLLVDYISKLKKEGTKIDAVIRGLRNAQDFEIERVQQYHNEDLGIRIPTYYVVSDRNLVHVSSSAIRMIEKARGK